MTADSSFQSFLAREVREGSRYHTAPRVIEGPQAHKVRVDGRDVIMLSSNNYLGLTTHPRVIKATKDAIDRYGVGLGCGRSIASMRIQLDLEERLAKFKHTEATLAFATGYDTNLGTVWALMDRGTTLFLDEYNHASVFDGAGLSGARVRVYPHRDMRKLESFLKTPDRNKRRFIITPSIFPLEGDIAELPEIVELAERYGASVYVDDAHAAGILGDHGRGSVDHFGLHGRVAVQVGTLSKALASVGGYVAGSSDLREYLFWKARPFAISTGHLAPPSVAAVIASLDVLEEDDSLLKRLWKNADYFRGGLNDLGFDTGLSETPIIPVVVKDAAKGARFSKTLLDQGILVRSFGPPTVPENTARLRTIVSATHSRAELDYALETFAKVGRSLEVIH
ncbi:MAG: aminotransferase class I/II-fold pyridoxal phosphate-dependent enzyme [Nitrososphaerota archaeon]|nr:aminotransferase class I/II-fold pyridoxal phosphate-dependent enzyme [Nitrososphaerota archaeon]